MKISNFELLLIFLVTTAVVVITICNAIIYNNIASDDEPTNAVSKTSARWYFWLNIIVCLLAFIIWCWAIYKWAFGSK
jgi:hypothetical protein